MPPKKTSAEKREQKEERRKKQQEKLAKRTASEIAREKEKLRKYRREYYQKKKMEQLAKAATKTSGLNFAPKPKIKRAKSSRQGPRRVVSAPHDWRKLKPLRPTKEQRRSVPGVRSLGRLPRIDRPLPLPPLRVPLRPIARTLSGQPAKTASQLAKEVGKLIPSLKRKSSSSSSGRRSKEMKTFAASPTSPRELDYKSMYATVVADHKRCEREMSGVEADVQRLQDELDKIKEKFDETQKSNANKIDATIQELDTILNHAKKLRTKLAK
jgi:hypothetical protein